MRLIRPHHFEVLPEAVFFDLDGTLYSYASCHKAAIEAAREKAKKILGIDDKTFEHYFQRGRDQVKEQLADSPSSHHRLLYFMRMIELLGSKSQPIAALDLEQTYWAAYFKEARLYPWVREFLETLRSFAIPSVLITNLNSHIQLRKILYFQIEELFDFIVTSEEAGRDKPHPAPFHLALKKLSAPPKVIWMIGDDPVCDIRGAKEAIGAVTIQWEGEGHLIAEEADAVLDRWDLASLLLEKMHPHYA